MISEIHIVKKNKSWYTNIEIVTVQYPHSY